MTLKLEQTFGFLLLIAVITRSTQVEALSQSTIDAAKKEIYNLINITTNQNNRGNNRLDHPLVGGFVRLSFHDCVGGCDGCINHDNVDNAGLLRYTSVLDPICNKYISQGMSRADCYALAGITAIEHAWETAMEGCVSSNGNVPTKREVHLERKKRDVRITIDIKDGGSVSVEKQDEGNVKGKPKVAKVQGDGRGEADSKRQVDLTDLIDFIDRNGGRGRGGQSGRNGGNGLGLGGRGGRNGRGGRRGPVICQPFGLVFRYGRKDCTTSPDTSINRKLPKAHGNLNATLKFFKDELGFSAQETVALIGAHTLGRAHRRVSGFNGRWTSTFDSLVNGFYRDLINPNHGFRQTVLGSTRNLPGPFFQWVFSEGRRCFLNSDMSLFKEIRPNVDGKTSCAYDNCPRAATAHIVEKYANDFSAWLIDFFAAYQKMIEHKSTNLAG